MTKKKIAGWVVYGSVGEPSNPMMVYQNKEGADELAKSLNLDPDILFYYDVVEVPIIVEEEE